VIDLRRDYRICQYNHGVHEGTHFHHPLDGPVGARIDIDSEADAFRLVRAYAQEHDVFGIEEFLEEIRQWKSG